MWELRGQSQRKHVLAPRLLTLVHATETARPRIQRQARRLTSAASVYDFDHVLCLSDEKGERLWSHSSA